jgi:hypothetical protein
MGKVKIIGVIENNTPTPEPVILEFDDWLEYNVDEIDIELAESGADRELDFDSEKEYEARYFKYLDNPYNK